MKLEIHKTAEKLRKEADIQAKLGSIQIAHRLLDIADDIDRIEEDLQNALKETPSLIKEGSFGKEFKRGYSYKTKELLSMLEEKE